MKYKIGVGITSRNRINILKTCLKHFRKNTEFIDKLVIIDDQSDEPISLDWSEFPYVTEIFRFNEHQGIPVCKNKCLELLDDCDYIFIFDDDCWPIKTDWEKLYIDTYLRSGNHHFSFTWTHKKNGTIGYKLVCSHKATVKKLIISEKSESDSVNISDTITDDEIDSIRSRMIEEMNIRVGFQYYRIEDSFKVIEETWWKINQFEETNGVMMFFTKRCIETAGGWDTNFRLYGCEHTELSERIANMNLCKWKHLDVQGSDRYFEALDRNTDHISAIREFEKKKHEKYNNDLLKSERMCARFKPYK